MVFIPMMMKKQVANVMQAKYDVDEISFEFVVKERNNRYKCRLFRFPIVSNDLLEMKNDVIHYDHPNSTHRTDRSLLVSMVFYKTKRNIFLSLNFIREKIAFPVI